MNRRQRIVVIGAGFGGLSFIKKIDKTRYDVVLVDRNNYHSFPPLFYQIASGGLEAASISFPLRRELRTRKMRSCRFSYGEVMKIDTSGKTVTTRHSRRHHKQFLRDRKSSATGMHSQIHLTGNPHPQ